MILTHKLIITNTRKEVNQNPLYLFRYRGFVIKLVQLSACRDVDAYFYIPAMVYIFVYGVHNDYFHTLILIFPYFTSPKAGQKFSKISPQ